MTDKEFKDHKYFYVTVDCREGPAEFVFEDYDNFTDFLITVILNEGNGQSILMVSANTFDMHSKE